MSPADTAIDPGPPGPPGPAPILSERRKTGLLCHVSPSLTVYAQQSPTGAQARAALDVYRSLCPPDKQTFVTGSRAPAFTKMNGEPGKQLLAQHLGLMDRRKDIAVGLWDGQPHDSWYLNITGVPPQDGKPRASFYKVTFPGTVNPVLVFQMAAGLADKVPFLSGHGGLTAHFDADFKMEAFNRIYIWARRYLGLEVEDLNVTVNHVLDGIKSANWLTLVGNNLWSRVEDPAQGKVTLSAEISVARATNGMVLRAGPAPMLGDRNAAQVPALYAEVARALAPLTIATHGEFPAKFEETSATLPWLHRFLTPDGWRW